MFNGGEVLVRTLSQRGVDTVFFVAGGTYVTVLEALSRQSSIRAVATRLESSATFAAEAYAALRRKPACVFVSRAPGAANASIGIHTAMQASRPMVLFVANIPRPMKQREAFQEVDYRLMYSPIAKAVFDVHSFNELAEVTARALDLSVSGRPGPVVVSVSRDVLDGETGEPTMPRPAVAIRSGPDADGLSQTLNLLRDAERPLVIAGEMVHFELAHEELKAFVARSGAGVLGAYRQQDVYPNTDVGWLGQLALNRTEHTEKALDDCDLLISLGSRLDSVTTDDYAMMRDHQKWVMVYPEPSAFSQWQPDVALAAHVKPTLKALIDGITEPPPAERLNWRAALHEREAAFAHPGDLAV
ncbi:MAG: thiamine pyrophosphate-binding protein, partial [Pseudomonadota bacterium]